MPAQTSVTAETLCASFLSGLGKENMIILVFTKN